MKQVSIWGIGFVVSLVLFIHFYLPKTITEINNPLLQFAKGIYQQIQNKPKSVAQTNYTKCFFSPKKLTWQSNEGLTLHADFLKANQPKGTILLLHGIQSSKERYHALMPILAEHGYSSVSLDLRAHRDSEGRFCTFGVKEKLDVQALISQLEENGVQKPFGIWGHSLGGAVALQSLALDSRLSFGIIESSFSSFETIVDDYFSLYSGFSFPIFSSYLARRAGRLSNFNASESSPIQACKQINQPMFLVHGDADKKISINYGKANFDALSSSKKYFLPIKNGSHDQIWEDAGKDYFFTVIQFIDSVVD